MIIVDIETSGLDPRRHCMLSLGAVDYDTGKEFYGECSVYYDSIVDIYALAVNGFIATEILCGKKQPAHELYFKFVQWSLQFPDKILAGHNIGHFDILFLEHYHHSYTFGFPFGFRTVDLHSVAYGIFRESLSHSDICRSLGLTPEPKPHNALSGARSERDAFRALFALQDNLRLSYRTPEVKA